MAIGNDTCAYSNVPRVSGMIGKYSPIKIPIIIQTITHTLRYLANMLSPSFDFSDENSTITVL